MAYTDTTERGLETLITNYLVNNNGYEEGANEEYNKEFAIDEARLIRFITDTQPEAAEKLGLLGSNEEKHKFLIRLRNEIESKGITEVLRNGVKDYRTGKVYLYYTSPSEKNEKSKALYDKNIFSVTRQFRYSLNNGNLALDLCVFINGLPVLTAELKNQISGQTVEDAVSQYKKDRSPKDAPFKFKQCVAHFAVDDARIKFCTKLAGKDSIFLPFDKGYKDGAGNPPNPGGIMTDYFWKDILTKPKLSEIIENYASVITEKDPLTNKKSVKQIFPRYHQLDAVEKLLADVKERGAGGRYLIQHSAGSGKSNSIAWLAHGLVGLEKDGASIFDSVIVVTDRVLLDKQIKNTIKQFEQVAGIVHWAKDASGLKAVIEAKSPLIITTIEKFPHIVKSVSLAPEGSKFAIIIDEAHSGQSGKNAGYMNTALSSGEHGDNEFGEDDVNAVMEKAAEHRRLNKNASYFAFTATPKNKTLEMFGYKQPDGTFVPFHNYSMKQAIDEGFILDVLKYYTPINSFYRIMKTIEDDPMYDKKRAQKKLRSFVEGDEFTINKKAKMMTEHFHESVIAKGKIGGKARAMIVTSSIPRCIEYYYAVKRHLQENNSPYKPIIAFSGEKEYKGEELTSAKINGFSDNEIPAKFKNDPYRILIVADMFQTGFDEPLLHTMYIDKMLTDIKAVQTLSRLNRSHPQKYDTFVLDFANNMESIAAAFSKYYRTTILSGETDPNKLYDLISIMENCGVYSEYDVDKLLDIYINGAGREALDPILDKSAANYKELDEEEQVEFKGAAKAFVRTYGFLSTILPYGNAEWEKISVFLNLLIPKLPSPKEDDLSRGILDSIDLESYRNEVRETIAIKLEDEDGTLNHVPLGNTGFLNEPELDVLSSIINDFNERFGNIKWKNADNVIKQLQEIPVIVAKDEKYRNAMKNSDEQTARLESERALSNTIMDIMEDNMELFKQYHDNREFRKWLSNSVFTLTYNKEGNAYDRRI